MAPPANPIILIPARLAAMRLPGKPLADIAGIPMIVRVLRQAEMAKVGPVAVAAGDEEIVRVVEDAGGRAVLTDPSLASGTDRIHAALSILDPEMRHDVVVNLQGDLPSIAPASLERVVWALGESDCDIATIVAPITDPEDRDNPNVVKPAIAWDRTGETGRALYFSRTPIPTGEGVLFHHIGVYAYKRPALERFVTLPPSELEQRERLEQLRAMEAGMRIAVARVDEIPLTIDTEADLAKARRFIS
jgi:3-deoxy-manno-octulosonate cytidylyltransferase (CMP-KDO synthetase)